MSFEEWKEVRLGEIVESISRKHSFDKERIIFLNTSDVYDGRVLNHEYVSINGLPGQAKKSIKKGDILFSEIRPINRRFAYIDFDAEDYVVSTKLMVLRSKEGVIPKFLYYFLSSNETLNILQMLAESRSGTFPQITFNELKSILIFLPPEDEQSRIINFMECIDKKIELNNQINKNLEEMAQAIFKSWFIDFEPFQDGEFVESELGLIPKGWEVKQIGNVCTVVGGGTPKTKVAEYWEGGDILWATPSDMTSKNCPVIYNTSRKITQEGLNNSAAKLLPSGSVIMTSRATIGYSAITMKELCTNQGFINVVCNKDISSYYMLFYLKHSKDKIIGLANGSTFLEISRKVFKEIDIVVPPKHILEKFNEIVEPIIQSIYQFEVEIQKLTNLRDTLLPKLMSGEIRVPLENEGRHQDEQLQRV